jgi:N-acetylmuramoyl-L-alanine amidase
MPWTRHECSESKRVSATADVSFGTNSSFKGVPSGAPGERGLPCRRLAAASATLIVFLSALLLFAAPAEKRISIYSTAANYSLPVVQREGRDYVGLLELLDPLGKVSSKSDGSHWRLRYNNVEGNFIAGKNRALVQGRDADLAAKFILDNGRGLVPLASLNSLLPRFLGGPATFHEESGRLFIGSVAIHFTAALSADNPPRLLLNFTSPVNPTIATEPGKLQMTFKREPVVAPASPILTFGNPTIPSATYSESNGAAQITVNTSVPLMATFGNDGRTITVSPASTAPPSRTIATAPATIPGTINTSPDRSIPLSVAPLATTAPATVARRYFAIVDASHGGDDRGEAISNTIQEKDLTVAFARRLRQELENRGISTLVLRDSDANLTLDERAIFTNSSHAALYISLHAASDGHGVRLYTALLPYALGDSGPFRAWDSAQSSFTSVSRAAAAAVAAELQREQIPVRTLTAPLRPLNNVAMAAIAVEIAPRNADVAQLNAPDYQQFIASALATGIAAARDAFGAQP